MLCFPLGRSGPSPTRKRRFRTRSRVVSPSRSLGGGLQGTVGDSSTGSSGCWLPALCPSPRGQAPGWCRSRSPQTELETGGEGRRSGCGFHQSPTSHFAGLGGENAARCLGALSAGKDGVFPRKEEGRAAERMSHRPPLRFGESFWRRKSGKWEELQEQDRQPSES